MRQLRRSVLALPLAALLFMTATASASIQPALTFQMQLGNASNVPIVGGYAFNVTTSGIVVAGLSVWDMSSNGLGDSHEVGLWDPAGNLLASATVPAGTTAPIDSSGFRYVAVPSLELPIADGYIVAAHFPSNADFVGTNAHSMSTAPGIVYDGGRRNVSATLTRPNSGGSGVWGGSFVIGTLTQAVPEPLSVVVWSALGCMAINRRWSRCPG